MKQCNIKISTSVNLTKNDNKCTNIKHDKNKTGRKHFMFEGFAQNCCCNVNKRIFTWDNMEQHLCLSILSFFSLRVICAVNGVFGKGVGNLLSI